MDHIDLVDRIVPNPTHTVVIETPQGEIVLVDTRRDPRPGDTVFAGDTFQAYQAGLNAMGVAYCVIKFL